MSSSIALLLLCTLGCVLAQAKVDKDYDPTNVAEMIRNNEKTYQTYLICLSNMGSCPPDGEKLKDALKTGCSKCTEKQHEGTLKIVDIAMSKEGKNIVPLVKMYDPNGKFKDQYADIAQKYGITL